MRSILFAALMSLPTLAAAQTPADLARLTWPLGAPVVATAQPSATLVAPGAATARDLARLAGVSGTRIAHSAAPTSRVAGAGTGADLASLLAGHPLIDVARSTPFTQTATVETPRR